MTKTKKKLIKYADELANHGLLTYEEHKIIMKRIEKYPEFKDSIPDEASLVCGNERPPRDVLCQLEKTHTGRHRAVIFWED